MLQVYALRVCAGTECVVLRNSSDSIYLCSFPHLLFVSLVATISISLLFFCLFRWIQTIQFPSHFESLFCRLLALGWLLTLSLTLLSFKETLVAWQDGIKFGSSQDLILTNNINLAQKVPPPGLVLDDSISLVLKETLETTVGLLLYKQAADECIGVLCNQILYTAQYNGIAGKETKILKTIGGDDFDWTPVQAPKSELRIPIPDGSFVLETLVQEQLVCSSEKMESCLDWGCGMPISLQIQETTSTNTTLDQIRTGTVEDAVYACRMHLTLVSEHRVLIERMVVRASYWTVSTMTFIQLLQRHSVCDGCLIEPIGQQLMLFDASFAVFCSIWSILSILVFLMSYRLKR